LPFDFPRVLYFLFFLSGISGLIYQAVWVRVFGNVFGNTVYSTSLVLAIFMLGLGAGSYLFGAWADRRYLDPSRPERAKRVEGLRAYGCVEVIVAIGGIGLAVAWPHLDSIATLMSSYSRGSDGWYALSPASYVGRVAIAAVLLTPITLLMGGTLTLLIRHLVRQDLEVGDRRIATLYAVNTAGAALGAFLTDLALVPALGLFRTQAIAAGLNAIAGGGALLLARRAAVNHEGLAANTKHAKRNRGLRDRRVSREATFVVETGDAMNSRVVLLTSLALAMTGFAAMGMEIVWFRQMSILLGAFRAVFALLLTVILLGIMAGSLISASMRHLRDRAAPAFMLVQALFVAATLAGLGLMNADDVRESLVSARLSGTLTAASELWFNARPVLIGVAVPALLMGFSYPLGNAIVQRVEASVGRRAGMLYLANTAGAVCGSVMVGFLLLPRFGIQGSGTILMIVAALALVPLARISRVGSDSGVAARPFRVREATAALIAAAALVAWFLLPSDLIVTRALGTSEAGERVVANTEGLTELVTIKEAPDRVRTLVTNGHPMSATTWMGQRYMRALAHIPLLSMDDPKAVLVIGFGVGNTTHAAALHPSIRSIEVADLSRNILGHAGDFTDVNHDVLSDPRVAVYVNDGRHHLRMRPAAAYDLITLEPPPIAYAGVAALYSTEFYRLARSRLSAGGYLSQWLPAYQVPASTTLAMIRSFVDVFPQSVLLSGAAGELLLVGTNGPRIAIDPERVMRALARLPDVTADLQRLDLGTPREIVGTFVGSASRLDAATRNTPAVTDDQPVQEYGVRSLIRNGDALPAAVVDLAGVREWCPTCFVADMPAPAVAGLDLYLALLERAYEGRPASNPIPPSRPTAIRERLTEVFGDGRYLAEFLPDSAEVHNTLGIALAQRARIEAAIEEFRAALRLEPESAQTHWHLGAALASTGARVEAIEHLRRAVELDPQNEDARSDLETVVASGKVESGKVEK